MRRLTSAIPVIVAALLPFPLIAVASPKFYAETLYARSKGAAAKTATSVRNQRTDVSRTVTVRWVNPIGGHLDRDFQSAHPCTRQPDGVHRRQSGRDHGALCVGCISRHDFRFRGAGLGVHYMPGRPFAEAYPSSYVGR